MLPRERVIQVLNRRTPDRVPLYGWVLFDLEKPIRERFGSVRAFEDKYEFDLAHVFGGPSPFDWHQVHEWRLQNGGVLTPEKVLDLPHSDPDRMEDYSGIIEEISHHKTARGRFVYVQTPAIFECLNGVFGIENHLEFLLTHPVELQEIYRRQAEWSTRFAMNCLDLGVDMIHLSDDWGAQNALMFSPKTWWKMIHPHHKSIARAVKGRGGWLSLHSDGNINGVIDGILDIGYDVVHPWQESAGMSLQTYRDLYQDRFTVMGGLDVQTVLGYGNLDLVRTEIRRVLDLFPDGRLIFCTTHFVNANCSVEELEAAFDLAFELVRRAPATVVGAGA